LTAGWVARQLDALDGLVPSAWTPGATDYTNTAYAILALTSAGVGSGAITTAAEALWNSDTAYIGAADGLATSWSAVATTALALDVAGRDVTAFPTAAGPRDLFADLSSIVGEDGAPGPAGSATAYGGSLAVLALARSAAGAPTPLVTWLEAQPCVDSTSPNFGAFGFTPGGCDSGDADSTALSVQALLAAKVTPTHPVVTAAQAWLEGQQDASGGWGTPGFTPINANTTGLVTQTLRALGSPAVGAAEEFLLSLTLGCAAVTTADPTGPVNAGAMAYSAEDELPDGATTDPTIVASLLSSSIQGLLGLGGSPLGALDVGQASAEVPSAALCLAATGAEATGLPVPVETTAEDLPLAVDDAADSGSSLGWWIGGGVAAVLLVGAVVGAFLSRRRSAA
jgi:hypothetical protein